MTTLLSLSQKKIFNHHFKNGIKDCVLILLDLSTFSLNKFSNYLTPNHFESAKKFKHSLFQHRFLLRKAILNYFLCHYLKCQINDLNIIKTSNNKPYIKNNPIYFNVSDSDRYYALSFSKYFSVGIDIELIRYIKSPLLLAKRFFTGCEIDFLTKSNSINNDFFKLWTQKEAYIKCIGQGISYGLNSFLIDNNLNNFTIIDPKANENFNGISFFNDILYLSICYQNNDICIYQDNINPV